MRNQEAVGGIRRWWGAHTASISFLPPFRPGVSKSKEEFVPSYCNYSACVYANRITTSHSQSQSQPQPRSRSRSRSQNHPNPPKPKKNGKKKENKKGKTKNKNKKKPTHRTAGVAVFTRKERGCMYVRMSVCTVRWWR